MHRVIAGNRQTGDDHFGRAPRRQRGWRQRIAHDAIVALRVHETVEQRDSGPAAAAARLRGIAKALLNIGNSVALRVLERQQKSAGVRRAANLVVIPRAASIDDASCAQR